MINKTLAIIIINTANHSSSGRDKGSYIDAWPRHKVVVPAV